MAIHGCECPTPMSSQAEGGREAAGEGNGDPAGAACTYNSVACQPASLSGHSQAEEAEKQRAKEMEILQARQRAAEFQRVAEMQRAAEMQVRTLNPKPT